MSNTPQPAEICDYRIARVVSLIQTDFRRELKLAQIATRVDLSPSRLRHLFKAHMGVTPSKFLKTRRLREAKKLAQRTNLRVKEIVCIVGVNDQSHFLRDFKRMYGCSLSEMRMRKQKHFNL